MSTFRIRIRSTHESCSYAWLQAEVAGPNRKGE
jgi:hypothetical protein